MTGYREDDDGWAAAPAATHRTEAQPGAGRPAAHVLADRVAAALIHHEPGWRLPRRSALARRYGVSPAEMEAAIQELSARHLLRRLPDGQVYRASPADYLIRLEGLPELRASIDPMGRPIDCASRRVSWRRVPEDIGGVLGVSPGDPACVIRCLWACAGFPVACTATYLSERHSFLAEAPPVPPALPDVLRTSQFTAESAVTSRPPDAGRATMPVPRPAGMYLELQPPAPSAARSLRLAAGEPAVTVTVRFNDALAGAAMALTTAVLRPESFRVVIESPDGPRAAAVAAGDDGIWARARGDREP